MRRKDVRMLPHEQPKEVYEGQRSILARAQQLRLAGG